MKILMIPSDGGGGFGHISRCLVLAQEAHRRGHSCAFMLSDSRYEKFLAREFPVFVARRYRGFRHWQALLSAAKRKMAGSSQSPIFFTGFSSLDYQVVRDGLTDEKILTRRLNEYLRAVRRFDPDVIVADTSLMARPTAKKAMLPIVQVVRYATHPDTKSIIWWGDESDAMNPPDSLKLVNPWLKTMDLGAIATVGDLLRGDLYLIPGIPELEPVPEDAQTLFTGQLSIATETDETSGSMPEFDDSLPMVYVTIGGGAGHTGNNLFFRTIIRAFADKPVQVIVSTGNKVDARDFSHLPANVRMFPWVPGKRAISKADLVVFHGGYATMMECVSYGKPSVVIPFQTEQEGNGRRLEQLGSSVLLKLSRDPGRYVTGDWPYGTFTFFVQERYDLTAEILYGEVSKVLGDAEYLKRVNLLKSRAEAYGGPAAAMDRIEKRWA
ncbi:MAG TPA: nucleotide disphospho-sugar-binding domain-containing protein [Syntrophorhabdaceae bacterium]|nr:nucleotide disphospho-sugar-binding domain-containing protein [Syntrophorhabdaceae bacterium]